MSHMKVCLNILPCFSCLGAGVGLLIRVLLMVSTMLLLPFFNNRNTERERESQKKKKKGEVNSY